MTILTQLCDETATSLNDWTEASGPETGVGVEYWFQHSNGNFAYICDDQGDISITFPYDDE